MAEVSLRHIEKVYPHAGGKRRAHKAKDGEKKGPDLKVTDEGVLAVEDFNLEVADREFVVLVGPRAAANRRRCAWLPAWKRFLAASSTSTASS